MLRFVRKTKACIRVLGRLAALVCSVRLNSSCAQSPDIHDDAEAHDKKGAYLQASGCGGTHRELQPEKVMMPREFRHWRLQSPEELCWLHPGRRSSTGYSLNASGLAGGATPLRGVRHSWAMKLHFKVPAGRVGRGDRADA